MNRRGFLRMLAGLPVVGTIGMLPKLPEGEPEIEAELVETIEAETSELVETIEDLTGLFECVEAETSELVETIEDLTGLFERLKEAAIAAADAGAGESQTVIQFMTLDKLT